jgi:septation ring formation regulator EzrA
MFHLWHILAIVIVFALGFFFGRLSMRARYEAKVEELENKKESIEWAARHH